MLLRLLLYGCWYRCWYRGWLTCKRSRPRDLSMAFLDSQRHFLNRKERTWHPKRSFLRKLNSQAKEAHSSFSNLPTPRDSCLPKTSHVAMLVPSFGKKAGCQQKGQLKQAPQWADSVSGIFDSMIVLRGALHSLNGGTPRPSLRWNPGACVGCLLGLYRTVTLWLAWPSL